MTETQERKRIRNVINPFQYADPKRMAEIMADMFPNPRMKKAEAEMEILMEAIQDNDVEQEEITF